MNFHLRLLLYFGFLIIFSFQQATPPSSISSYMVQSNDPSKSVQAQADAQLLQFFQSFQPSSSSSFPMHSPNQPYSYWQAQPFRPQNEFVGTPNIPGMSPIPNSQSQDNNPQPKTLPNTLPNTLYPANKEQLNLLNGLPQPYTPTQKGPQTYTPDTNNLLLYPQTISMFQGSRLAPPIPAPPSEGSLLPLPGNYVAGKIICIKKNGVTIATSNAVSPMTIFPAAETLSHLFGAVPSSVQESLGPSRSLPSTLSTPSTPRTPTFEPARATDGLQIPLSGLPQGPTSYFGPISKLIHKS